MEFTNIRHILSTVRRAVDDYSMIEEGDKIAVGVSGGKDSLTLLAALVNLRIFYPKKFTLHAISISMGYEEMDFSQIERFCAENEVPFTLVNTELARIIFDIRKEKNPCSLCAKMRRGILHDTAVRLGCNKVALGHHFDDAIETFMLNLFNEGRLAAFLPVTYLSRKKITLIRPLLYTPEKDIRYFIAKNGFIPVLENPCPANGHTQRESVKQLLAQLNRENRGLKHRVFDAIQKGGLFEQYEEEGPSEPGTDNDISLNETATDSRVSNNTDSEE